MFKNKHFKILILISVLLFILAGCKAEEVEKPADISKIKQLIKETENDANIKELNELIIALKDAGRKEAEAIVEEKIIGKAQARLPKWVEFGTTYRDFEYKDERIEFLNKTWEIIPYYNLGDLLSAVVMNYEYDYSTKDPETFKKDIQSILTILVKEYGTIIYSENPTFETISELDKNRLYMAFEADEFYLGTYVINDSTNKKVIFTLAYFSKEQPHEQYSMYYPLLAHMEKAVTHRKGYSDISIQFIQQDGQVVTYMKNVKADSETREFLKILSTKLPPAKDEKNLEAERHDRYLSGEDDYIEDSSGEN